MNAPYKKLLSWALPTLLLLAGGCRSSQGICDVDCCADIPSGAIPNGPGAHLCQWQQTQVASAATDQGVFYRADFIDQSDQLSPAALRQVATLAQQGELPVAPIIIEPSGDSMRDADRTVSLAAAFSAAGAPLMADEIQLAYPPALGLDGFRAQQVARNASRNGSGGGGQSGGGGFGGGIGGGFGGGGMGGGFGGGGFGGGGIF
ncbi:hypothetical protein [Allorhodopirellula solitaria]|uniref:Uncharacterized protein n=1 Tax=Allorhodopirellula solitaria TaxID=2527987 RepID=A0A5C5YE79_9BACT|nr:hypothetical protein [Allorhodopirellula solitaria]TWT73344.1 hypothetical protein CA85_18130 [Allorhodopirellula solitaria]